MNILQDFAEMIGDRGAVQVLRLKKAREDHAADLLEQIDDLTLVQSVFYADVVDHGMLIIALHDRRHQVCQFFGIFPAHCGTFP